MSTGLPDGVSVRRADMLVRVSALVNLMRDYLHAPEGSADESSALDAIEEYIDEMLDDQMVARLAIVEMANCIVTAADQAGTVVEK